MLGRGWIHHVTSSLRYGVGLPLLVYRHPRDAAAHHSRSTERRTGRGLSAFLLSPRGKRLHGVCEVHHPGRAIPVFDRRICCDGSCGVGVGTHWPCESGNLQSSALSVVCLAWPSAQSVVSFNRLIARTDSRVLARAVARAAYSTRRHDCTVGNGRRSGALVPKRCERGDIRPGQTSRVRARDPMS